MKVNYRTLFVKTLAGINNAKIKQLKEFTLSKPLPCWGGIYQKVKKMNLDDKLLINLIENWIDKHECEYFILLVLKIHKKNSKLIKYLTEKIDLLPENVRIYLASHSDCSTAFKNLSMELPIDLHEIVSNPSKREKEIQIIESKIGKLLRFNWAPTNT